jgi:catechol 2,3-dioxygenase-like lactoylglutathione lyase family enzyme
MSGERSYAVLPCPALEEALDFYCSLGFEVTFKQLRPYACAVVRTDDLHIHLAEIPGFDPTNSYASVIITSPDLEQLYQMFTAGVRRAHGRIPVAGIPRILPIRRKSGTATGFSVVDVGGNWLRFYRDTAADTHDDDTASAEEDQAPRTGLGRVIDVAARQGDSRGDELRAISVLDAGLIRHPDAPGAELFEAVLYRAELKHRIGADPTGDLDAAERLLRAYTFGEEAERALVALRESRGDIHLS